MKWEYKTFNERLTDEELNKLGQDNWELVSHSCVSVPSLFGHDIVQYYVFKRKIYEPPLFL
jgi:aspartate-semialdehyde dehydrogenase